MERNNIYRRMQRARHICRKKRIIKEQNDYWRYKFDGCLDKGKIHCSCYLCRHSFGIEPRFSDRRQASASIAAMRGYGPAGERAANQLSRRFGLF